MKTFIALEFDNNTKKVLASIQKILKQNSVKGRWVYTDNFHMTLKYLGNTTPHQIEDLAKILENITKSNKFLKLSLNNLDYFRGKDILRVVWLGLDGDVENIITLSKNIDKKIIDIGFSKNKKDYIPHITLGRDVVFDSTLFKINDLIENKLKHSFNIDAMTLMKSELLDNKRVYTPIKKFKFKEND